MAKDRILPVKVALITGAARRIGAEIAQTLHATGMNIVLHYHQSSNEARALCAAFNALRADSASLVQANLTEIECLPALIQQAVEPWGRLDVLVNNASVFYATPLGGVREPQWDDLFACNIKAPFFLSQAAQPYLKLHKGCIINLTDIHGEAPLRQYSVYSLTKAALLMATRSMAKEWGPEVRVNAVSPGAICWPEGENTLSGDIKQKIIEQIALGHEGQPQDVAKAVLYFVRDAEYVTGQVLAVDGGRSLS